MNTPHLRLLGFLFLSLTLSGCSTIDTRIQEKSAAFVTLTPEMQDKIRLGRVEVGFSADLVYIALGTPDERSTKSTATGRTETWIYNSYRQEYLGSAHIGYRQHVLIDPKTRQTIVTYEPVYSSIYRDRVDERIRLIFKKGLVESIEEVKRDGAVSY